MTVADLPMPAGVFFGTSTDQGVSADAGALRRQIVQAVRSLCDNLSVRDAHDISYQALREAAAEASSQGWDGYGGKPVTPKTVANATWFLRSLPSTVPIPEVAVDPDGEISLQWRGGPNRAFSVSIGQGDTIAFAGLNGRRKIHGTEVLLHEIPNTVLEHLGRTLVE